MKNIYDRACIQHLEIASHYSDLYLKQSPLATQLVKDYTYSAQVSTFLSAIDGVVWYDIPFAYTPYWDSLPAKIETSIGNNA
jgi:hypothetical protein